MFPQQQEPISPQTYPPPPPPPSLTRQVTSTKSAFKEARVKGAAFIHHHPF